MASMNNVLGVMKPPMWHVQGCMFCGYKIVCPTDMRERDVYVALLFQGFRQSWIQELHVVLRERDGSLWVRKRMSM